MAVKIRLTRVGAKKRPFYRVLAIDERAKRDGRPLEFLGTYDPRPDQEIYNLDLAAIDKWIAKGAQMSGTVASLVRKSQKNSPKVATVPNRAR